MIVFEIHEVDHTAEENCVVFGRALEDMAVGDLVWLDYGDSRVNFTVKSFSTYGHEVDELPRGMSGFVELMTDANVLIYHASYLNRTIKS